MKQIFLTLLIFFFIGCGYKPASLYTKEFFSEPIYTEVEISLAEPENSVYIKDAVNEAVVVRFKGQVTKDSNANSKLFVTIEDIDFRAIEYDKDGYITRYSIKVVLDMDYRASKKFKFKTDGFYEFKVEPASIVTDIKRYEAIKEASSRAIDMFITKILILGYR
jgi:hypothetical protein